MIHEEEAALGAQALRAGALRGIMVPSPEGNIGPGPWGEGWAQALRGRMAWAMKGRMDPSPEGKDGCEPWGEGWPVPWGEGKDGPSPEGSRQPKPTPWAGAAPHWQQGLCHSNSRKEGFVCAPHKLFQGWKLRSEPHRCAWAGTPSPDVCQLWALEHTHLRRWTCPRDVGLSRFWTQKPASKAKPNSLGKQSKAPLCNSWKGFITYINMDHKAIGKQIQVISKSSLV